jgi:hypothetical protein
MVAPFAGIFRETQAMTAFLESFATRQLLPPWHAKAVNVSCFVFALQKQTIQAYLDKFFNFGGADRAPFRFVASEDLQHGVLMFQHYPDIWSENKTNMPPGIEDGQGWDHLSYNQTYVTVPVVRYAITAENLLVDPQIYWIQPVVICDNSSVVYASREIVGIDMIQGIVDFNQTAVDLGKGVVDFNPHAARAKTPPVEGGLHVDTYIIGVEKFSPRSCETVLPFVHVETGPPVDGASASAYAIELLAKLSKVFGVDGQSAGMEGRLVTLKQFRDSQDMTRATYQAIVSSHSKMSAPADVKFYDPATVAIDFMWSATANEILSSFLDLTTFTDAAPDAPDPQERDRHLWASPHKKIAPEFCFSFTVDLDWSSIQTLHTFGQRD